MTMPKRIETERLVLRPQRPDDAEAITKLLTFEVARYLTNVPWPYASADAQVYLAGVGQRSGVYAVTRDGAYVGAMGGPQELGYWFGAPYWGKGYATEAAAAFCDHWFRHTDASRLRASYAVANKASGNVLRKLGFLADGHKVLLLNRGRERALMRTVCLTRSDWQALTADGDSAKRDA